MKTLFGDLNVSRLTIPFLFVWMLLETSAHADALDYWLPSQVVTNPTSAWFRGVTFGNGRFLAVGEYYSDEGFAQTSDDGVHWILQRPGISNLRDLYDVTFGSNTFVAVGWGGFGTPNIYNSYAGDIWGQSSTASANILHVTYGGGRFVAVGDGQFPTGGITVSNIYTSPNGYTWTAQHSGAPTNNFPLINDVAYGNNVYAAIAGQYVHLSPNSSYWIRRTNSVGGGRISFCNDRFIISAGAGTNLVSADGNNWTLLTNNTGASFGRIVYGDGYYVTHAVSNVSKIFTSTDATNWIGRPTQFPTNTYLWALTFGNHKFMAVGGGPGSQFGQPVAYVSDLAMPSISLIPNPALPPKLNVSGVTGRTYRIDWRDNLTSANWQTATTFILSNNPSVWTDTTATNSARYYRAVLLP